MFSPRYDRRLILLNIFIVLFRFDLSFYAYAQVTYGSLINALAVSSHPNKTDEAKRLYNEMKENGLEVDTITANALLRCCSSIHGKNSPEPKKRGTLQFAMEMFQKIHRSERMRPSFHTYMLFLIVCRRTSEGKEYEKLVEMTFKLCTSNGLLDKKTFKTLSSDASKSLLRRLLGRGGRVSFEELPKEWSKNI